MGNQNAGVVWSTLVGQHSRGLFGLAAHMLGDRSEAEDVVQETFLRAYIALDQRGTAVHTSMRAWLNRIAVNLCYDRLRRKSWHELPAGSGADLVATQMPAAGATDWVAWKAADPEATTLAGEEARQIASAMATLPANHRAAVILRYHHDLSYREIAEVLQVPENTIATWLRRGHLALRRQLDREEGEPCRVTAPA